MRDARSVIGELLSAMDTTVTDYGSLGRTNASLESFINGTAVFPGGSGLWRGEQINGALPKYFPSDPIMFIAHNFDSQRSHDRSLLRGSESLKSPFWKHLRAYLDHADIPLEACFFTNALMGLQPGSSRGPMSSSDLFKKQCRDFLQQQIKIVRPRGIAILGSVALNEVDHVNLGRPSVAMLHPSALIYKKLSARQEFIAAQGRKLSSLRKDEHIVPNARRTYPS
jgi:hypothetical protein